MNKRSFLKTIRNLSLAPLIIPTKPINYIGLKEILPKKLSDQKLWEEIRSHYKLKPDYINLESGYYNIIPQPTLEKHLEHIKRVNLEGSYYMRKHRFIDKDSITDELASFVGCNAKNLVVTRNTTESLDLVISGFPWKKGDEAVYAIQDYGAMQDMFEQIEKRHNVTLRKVSVPNHPKNDEEIVSIYEKQITKKTKLIMVCHMINITGQILPIKKICEMAHSYGVEVMVDGAHCVGHFDFFN